MLDGRYKSDYKYKNRYGDTYEFVSGSGNFYKFIMNDLKYCRYGGDAVHDLEFVDPSGGPYLGKGMRIDGKVIKRIDATDGIKLEYINDANDSL